MALVMSSTRRLGSTLVKRLPGPATMRSASRIARMVSGRTISIVGSIRTLLLAGSETGLGIPKPPFSLSCSYNKQARTIDVRWINPSGDCQYDSLYILWRYRNRPEDALGSGGGELISGTPNNFIIKLPEEVNDLDTDIWIKGLRHENPVVEFHSPLGKNAIPSNVTAIHNTLQCQFYYSLCCFLYPYISSPSLIVFSCRLSKASS